MKKAVFLDRDGTINVDLHYVCTPSRFVLIPGVEEALLMLQKLGFRLIIITNQSGVARGLFSIDDVERFNKWTFSFFRAKGINISGIYYCPHLPGGSVPEFSKTCDCRKPGTSLFFKAASDFDISLPESYVIGDKMSDCALAIKQICKGYLLGETEGKATIEDVSSGLYNFLRYKKDLLSCAIDIREREGTEP